MTRRKCILGLATLGVAAFAASGGGCGLFRPIQFTNVTDSWLNVRFYAGEPDPSGDPSRLVSNKAFEVAPGMSVRFTPTAKLVHVRVDTLAPSWEEAHAEYWLEVMTRPPVHIVATGRSDRLDFKAGSGEVALIPQRELTGGRFEHRIAGAADDGGPVSPNP